VKAASSTSNSRLFGFDPAYVADLIRFVTKLIAVFAVFGLFELLAHAFTPNVHPFWGPTEEKQRVYERMLAGGARYDVLMIGSSMTQAAFDPEAFDPLFGSRSFNAGIAGRSNTSLQLEMIREIIESQKPKLVLYGIESWSLAVDPYVPGTQMFQFLALFQNREQISRWVKAALRGSFSKPPAFIKVRGDAWIWADNRFLRYTSQTVHPNGFVEVDAVAHPDFHATLPPFRALHAQAKALEAIRETARQTGVQVVFVQTPEFGGEIAKSRERQEAFRNFMLENVVAKGSLYLDFNLELPFPRENNELYYDTNHLNGHGARLFSEALAKQLLAHCGPMPVLRCS
jgi:hypothetical protein